MTTECPIYTGIFDGFSWIRCEGKGSFLNSPTLKAFGVERIAAGERCLVVDLEGCSGMDSTFMGTLAGLATRLSAQDGGTLQIAGASERNRHSLEDLGLDFLIQIEPESAAWRAEIQTIRGQLQSSGPAHSQSSLQKAMHVLEAHQVLSEANDKNSETFSTVVTLLESEVEAKRKSSGAPDER
ncbi:MAG: STAS domain-containing protein [Luteolibacter sp.]